MMCHFKLGIFCLLTIVLTVSPAFSLTLQEKMDLVRKQELQRRNSVVQEHRATVKPETQVPAATPTVSTQSESASGVILPPMITMEEPIGDEPVFLQDGQLWAGIKQASWERDNVTFHLYFSSTDNGEPLVFLARTYRDGTRLDVYDLTYLDDQHGFSGTHRERLVKRRFLDELPTIEGQLGDGGRKLIFQYSKKNGKKTKTVELGQVSTSNPEAFTTFEKNRAVYISELQERERQVKEQEEREKQTQYYRDLVITAQVDSHGVKTFETLKLEEEKRRLRPLTEKETAALKETHASLVQQAIDEEQRLAKQRMEQARIKAEIARREVEPLVVFNSLELSDPEIDREEIHEAIMKAGGRFLTAEELREFGETPPNMDYFDASAMLPGAVMGFVQFVEVEGLFSNSDYLVFFSYMFDSRQTLHNYRKKLEEKYGPPSEKSNDTWGWKRDSGASAVQVVDSPPTSLFDLEGGNYILSYVNTKNLEMLDEKEKETQQKQQQNF